jgi:hypothetical protein
MGIVDRVADYFIALIVGVILLYVLISVIASVFQTLPQYALYGVAIILAAIGALLVLAKKGIR